MSDTFKITMDRLTDFVHQELFHEVCHCHYDPPCEHDIKARRIAHRMLAAEDGNVARMDLVPFRELIEATGNALEILGRNLVTGPIVERLGRARSAAVRAVAGEEKTRACEEAKMAGLERAMNAVINSRPPEALRLADELSAEMRRAQTAYRRATITGSMWTKAREYRKARGLEE